VRKPNRPSHCNHVPMGTFLQVVSSIYINSFDRLVYVTKYWAGRRLGFGPFYQLLLCTGIKLFRWAFFHFVTKSFRRAPNTWVFVGGASLCLHSPATELTILDFHGLSIRFDWLTRGDLTATCFPLSGGLGPGEGQQFISFEEIPSYKWSFWFRSVH